MFCKQITNVKDSYTMLRREYIRAWDELDRAKADYERVLASDSSKAQRAFAREVLDVAENSHKEHLADIKKRFSAIIEKERDALAADIIEHFTPDPARIDTAAAALVAVLSPAELVRMVAPNKGNPDMLRLIGAQYGRFSKTEQDSPEGRMVQTVASQAHRWEEDIVDVFDTYCAIANKGLTENRGVADRVDSEIMPNALQNADNEMDTFA